LVPARTSTSLVPALTSTSCQMPEEGDFSCIESLYSVRIIPTLLLSAALRRFAVGLCGFSVGGAT
jgi:hypothetical protein